MNSHKETRRGRPQKPVGVAKRAQFNARVRPALRERLDKAAQENRRSLSEEAEARLEQSFAVELALMVPDAMRMAATFALTGQRAAEYEGHPEWVATGQWRTDPICYQTALLATIKEMWRQHPQRRDVRYSWREWFERAFGFVAGLYAPPDVTRKDLTIEAARAEFDAGRREFTDTA